MFRLLICCLLLTSLAEAQNLTFSAGENARADGASPATFVIANDGGVVLMSYTQAAAGQTAAISFDIYRIAGNKEVYHATVKQTLNGKTVANKQVWFYEEGRYRVYVFDDQDQLLEKAEFTVRKNR